MQIRAEQERTERQRSLKKVESSTASAQSIRVSSDAARRALPIMPFNLLIYGLPNRPFAHYVMPKNNRWRQNLMGVAHVAACGRAYFRCKS